MLIIADPNRQFRSRISRQLGSGSTITQADSLEQVRSLLRESGTEVEGMLLGPNFEPQVAIDAASRLQTLAPGVGIVLIAPEVNPDLLRAAMHAGLRDVLADPVPVEQLREALGRLEAYARKLHQQQVSTSEDASKHKIITVFSTKGGAGKSFVASNLAILLAQKPDVSVALVDLDLQSGDLAIMLQLRPSRTLHDVARDLGHLDAHALNAYLTPHRSGVQLLAAPIEPSQADDVTTVVVEQVLDLLREQFDFVVVDSPALFTDEMLTVFDSSDEVLLVTSMDVPSIKNTKLALQTLEQLGIERDRIRLVLNRADSNVGLRIDEIEKVLNATIDVSIPSSRSVPLSVNQGTPLSLDKRRSAVVEPLVGLAGALHANGHGQSANGHGPQNAESDSKSSRFSFFRRN